MVLSVTAYLAAFGLAWAPVIDRGLPWAMFLFTLPILWILGTTLKFPLALTVGLYGVVALAGWAAFSDALFPALAAMPLALLAWDSASLTLWLRKGCEVQDKVGIWQGLILRSIGAGAAGSAIALGFARFELALPFWGLVGLLVTVWLVLAALRRATGRTQPEPVVNSPPTQARSHEDGIS